MEHPLRRPFAAALGGAALLLAGAAAASRSDGQSYLPPWIDAGTFPLPAGTKSARIRLADQPLLTGPYATAPRRGTAIRDAHLPIFAARRGPGCDGYFLHVGPSAWVCDSAVLPTSRAPIEADERPFANSRDGLPFRYFFVGPDGSFAYHAAGTADIGAPSMQLEPGFAVAIVAERTLDGNRYGRTEHGLWVPMRDLGAIASFPFHGEALDSSTEPTTIAWIAVDKARVYDKPSAAAKTSSIKMRFELVRVQEEARGFYRIDEHGWIAAKDARRPTSASPPPEVDVEMGQKWIDVDLASQTLVAYEGNKAVYATLVSTGKGRQNTSLATPKGTHRLWIKLLSSDMDNLEDENAARYYRMENVPWVQYFSKGVGLHGAFWHRSFGYVRSHGCVNLAPLDAERLFFWTEPRLPAGWTAVFPTRAELGTVVRVR